MKIFNLVEVYFAERIIDGLGRRVRFQTSGAPRLGGVALRGFAVNSLTAG